MVWLLIPFASCRTLRAQGGKTMKTAAISAAFVGVLVLVSPVFAGTYTIPTEKVDQQKIFWGDAGSFDKPGEVSYADIIKATPEFEELRRKRIESGSARYYHLMTQASERAVRAIIEVGRSSEFDLVAMKGYLATLEEPIEAADLTELVLRRLRNGGNAS